jgi:hypothetical protein
MTPVADSASPAQVEVMAAEYVRPTWRECAQMLVAVAGGARPDDQPRDLMVEAIGSNLIRREEQEKPCRTCGKPRHDFSFWRITAAGRLLIAAFEDVHATAIAQQDALIGELLAVIHRDGGQYLDTHGMEKATRDAMQLSSDRIADAEAALGALSAAKGYLLNAQIDLETGCAKATAIATIKGGIKRVEQGLSRASQERA